jgi:sulfatase maturation enzyme AslB (radical SAM superfamily)
MNFIIFDWITNYECNYRCPYCWFHNQWEDLKNFDRYISQDRIVKFWKDIYQKYGSVQINISGGEPFLYSNFVNLLFGLLELHRVEIMSNLSLDVCCLLNKFDSLPLNIVPSFHPLFADFIKFKEQAIVLKEKGFVRKISYLAWPPQIPKLNHYRDEFTKLGFHFFARPFFGIFNSKKYPDMYTDEEKEIILGSVMPTGDSPASVEPIVTKGKLCRAGEKYALVQPDGRIYRCGATKPSQHQELIMGDVSAENFSLYDKPKPCNADGCICNMWSFLLAEQKSNEIGK